MGFEIIACVGRAIRGRVRDSLVGERVGLGEEEKGNECEHERSQMKEVMVAHYGKVHHVGSSPEEERVG